jgi:hypothetical protein
MLSTEEAWIQCFFLCLLFFPLAVTHRRINHWVGIRCQLISWEKPSGWRPFGKHKNWPTDWESVSLTSDKRLVSHRKIVVEVELKFPVAFGVHVVDHYSRIHVVRDFHLGTVVGNAERVTPQLIVGTAHYQKSVWYKLHDFSEVGCTSVFVRSIFLQTVVLFSTFMVVTSFQCPSSVTGCGLKMVVGLLLREIWVT